MVLKISNLQAGDYQGKLDRFLKAVRVIFRGGDTVRKANRCLVTQKINII